jgi:hypothetical protein
MVGPRELCKIPMQRLQTTDGNDGEWHYDRDHGLHVRTLFASKIARLTLVLSRL